MRKSNTFITATIAALCVTAVLATTVWAGARHTVQRGDTLSEMAQAHRVTTSALARHNGISNPDRIFVGQTINIPGRAPASTSTYTIRRGDTLNTIAAAHGTTWRVLQSANNIADVRRLRIGQVITIPAARPAQLVAPTEVTAPVTSGDPAARYPNLPRSLTRHPDRIAYIPLFEKWAEVHDVPVDLLMAIAFQESGWRKDARPRLPNGQLASSAVGIGQILVGTGYWLSRNVIGLDHTLDRYDPDSNIRMMAAYIDWLRDNTGNRTLAHATRAYYQGASSITARGVLQATRSYYNNVQSHRGLFLGA